jgi:hypothetical protein
MRFGYWREATLAIALISAMATTRSASADWFHHTIPPEILAQDLNTGQPYFAPAIPWGHYAKDGIGDHFGKSHCGICGLLKGKGAGLCGGHGLFHRGGNGGCGDPGCGICGNGGSGWGHGKRIKNCGLCGGKGCGLCNSSGAGEPIHALASNQGPAPAPQWTSPQAAPIPSSQACSEPGCSLGRGHHDGDPCGSCGGKGCGLCGGLGRLFGHNRSACDSCGGQGCGKCGLFGRGNGCGFCGGRGCGMCAGIHGKLSHLLHPGRGKIKYFVGPGGPVPLTPGYVPYVNPVRSPRDFLAFPPYTPDGY